MGYKTNTSGWDPDTVLELIHPLRGTYRCTGEASSKRRRCMNAVRSFGEGRAILRGLTKMSVSEAITSTELKDAALCTLCYLHKHQADVVTSNWASLLKRWASQNQYATKADKGIPRPRKQASHSPTYGDNVNFTFTGSFKAKQEDDWKNLYEDFAEANERLNKTNELLRFLAEMLAKQEAEIQARERREKEKKERERRKSEEKEAREREAREREAREREARRKAEQDRKEREAREERLRAAKEQGEKNARNKAAREGESWMQSWKTYAEAWDRIKAERSKECPSKRKIPWPVKSGLWCDVDATNVELFFSKAPPSELIETAEDRFKLMNVENKKWHTDKIMHQFGASAITGENKEPLNIIARVLIQLRQEAQREKRQ